MQRMILHSTWPTRTMGRQWGRAVCSPAIGFTTTTAADTYIIEGAGSSGDCSEPSLLAESPALSIGEQVPNRVRTPVP